MERVRTNLEGQIHQSSDLPRPSGIAVERSLPRTYDRESAQCQSLYAKNAGDGYAQAWNHQKPHLASAAS